MAAAHVGGIALSTRAARCGSTTMKLGYSILLGETVNASEVEYRDCEHFQIVCPVCREPVYKIARRVHDGDAQQFLSHYAAAKSYAADCELRVRGLSADVVSRGNVEAREQRLAYFLSVMTKVLGRSAIYTTEWRKTHYRISRSKAMDMLFAAVCDVIQQAGAEAMFEDNAQDHLQWLRESGWGLKTTFDIHRQTTIAKDLWLTVCTPMARTNLRFLFNHAFLLEFSGWLVRSKDEASDDRAVSKRIADYMMAAMQERGAEASSDLIQGMMAEHLPAGFNKLRDGRQDDWSSSYFTRILGNVSIEMVGCLLSMPYAEMLRERYGDPGKVYLQPEGVGPVTDEAIAAMKNSEFVDGSPLPARPKPH
jgi:hypothetical protein